MLKLRAKLSFCSKVESLVAETPVVHDGEAMYATRTIADMKLTAITTELLLLSQGVVLPRRLMEFPPFSGSSSKWDVSHHASSADDPSKR